MEETALSFLLEQLRDVWKWCSDLLSNAENDFKQLEDDLKELKALLSDAAKKPDKIDVYKEMERQIREVVYVVEDTIDHCLTKAFAAKEKNPIRRRLTTTSTKFNLANEVRSLRIDTVNPVLVKVRSVFATLGAAIGPDTAADQPQQKPKKDQTIRRDKVVGFEDEEATLMGYLTAETKELDVISIIGMPGLGKTTLAMKIFENEDIRFQFPIRIWVYVSQRFNSREVFLNILKKFTSNDMSGLSDEELAQSVRACLAKEKFLLVMDDVWSTDDWNVIRDVLPKSNGSSKVMITSRHKSIGTHANVRRPPHMLRFFTPDESWKLLRLEVFDSEEACPPELVNVGKEIAEQCDGVPLTVVVVGGILVDLFDKPEVNVYFLIDEWEEVSQHVHDFVGNDPEKRISDVVKLSYDKLPEHLRECFIYMAVFPEEHVIPSWMLTRLWIAEGFIRPRGKSLEEAAEENLSDLVSRNLLMLDAINPMGEVKTCRVHDMIRGFCRELAFKQNLFQEITKNKQGVLEPPVSEVPKFHRLCFHSDLTKFFSGKPNGPSIRSFLSFYKEPVSLDEKYISTIPDAFLKLRVLESISIKFHQFPAKVTKLIHLRYVTLNIDVLTILPEPLTQLWNLQTLVVETKSNSITMKANMWKMYRLRHLKMKAAIILNDKWEGDGGENLQTLSRLAPESCTAKVCEKACNLRELGIRGNLATLFRKMSMGNLDRLEKLKLINDLIKSESQLPGLPQRECFPPKLQQLTLSNTFLNWQHASKLADIDTLKVLKLKNNAFTGTSWNADKNVFKKLQILLIKDADLVDWKASAGTFPILRCLVLKNCDKLETIPGGVGGKLETLDIDRVTKSAVDSANSIAAERRAAQAQEQRTPILQVQFKLQVGPGCGK